MSNIPIELKKNPYEFICDYYESIYPYVGKRVFSILSLVIPSLIIPKIQSQYKTIKQKLNLLWLAPIGMAKTSISEEFEKITLNPISTHRITPARLVYELKKRADKKVTLIVSDIATMFQDEVLIKVLEGITGDEGTISWDTMRTKNESAYGRKIDAVVYLSGTPKNISDQKIRDGILGRTYPLVIYLTEKEHIKILRIINERMGKKVNHTVFDHIKNFYKDLYKIQEGIHNEINPIEGYVFPEKIKEELGKYVENLSFLKEIFNRWRIPGIRALEESYRLLVSHAFLNIYHREIRDNKMVVNEEDLKIAKRLIKLEEYYSYIIYKSIERIDYYKIKTERELRTWIERMRKAKKTIPKTMEFVMDGLVKK